MVKITKILVDLDEVLADFVGGAAEVWGTNRAEIERLTEPGTWDMKLPLDKILKRETPLTDGEFWSRLNTVEFWENLKELPWMDEVVGLVNQASKGNWRIVTAPSQGTTSYDGKVRWLKKRFGHKFDKFAITPHKEDFAKPGVLLIDDRESNLTKFRAEGGQGCLFPRMWNSHHPLAHDPITYVRIRLEGWSKGYS